MAGDVVHLGAKPQGSDPKTGYHVNYLEQNATLAYPNVKLVSTDGAIVKLNSALLASASTTLRYILNP